MEAGISVKAESCRTMVKIFRTYARQFILLIAVYFLNQSHLLAQQPGPDDYSIYSCIIRSEITDTIRSIALLKNGIRAREVSEYTQNIALALKSGNQNALQNVYSWTESGNGQRPTAIDTLMNQYILDFCSYPSAIFELSDRFQIPCKTILLNHYPIRASNSNEDWNNFYEKYPGSGGIFSFSRILYYNANRTTAIVYFWHRRYDLNGHGALAILRKVNERWEIQYKTYLWWN